MLDMFDNCDLFWEISNDNVTVNDKLSVKILVAMKVLRYWEDLAVQNAICWDMYCLNKVVQ